MNAVQDQRLDELLQKPLNEESFGQLLVILGQKQRTGLKGDTRK